MVQTGEGRANAPQLLDFSNQKLKYLSTKEKLRGYVHEKRQIRCAISPEMYYALLDLTCII
jgi:hypothetical protein